MQNSAKFHPSLIILFGTAISLSLCTLPEQKWLTVLTVSKNNGSTNIYSLLMSDGTLNDGAGKMLSDPPTIAINGNFKSNLTDVWSDVRPTKVRLSLYNEEGYMVWFTDFQSSTGSKDPRVWMTTTSIATSSDRKLTSSSAMATVFDSTKLEIRSVNNLDGRLLLTWNPQPVFLFSSKQWERTPPPLTLPAFKSNKDMVLAKANANTGDSFTFSSGSAFLIYLLSANYLAGMGFRENVTSPGQLRQVMVQVSMDPACYPYRPQYDHLYRTLHLPGSNNPVVFNLTYNQGENGSLALIWFDHTVAAYCVKLVVLSATPDHDTGVYIYHTEHTVLEASTFAIQWWIETPEETTTASCRVMTVCDDTSYGDVTSGPDVTVQAMSLNMSEMKKMTEAIQQTLGVPKEETTKFKRQFISVPDHRPSAVMIGALGVSVISIIVISIVILDFTTISVQLKHLIDNIRHGHAVKTKNRAKQSKSNSDNLQVTDIDDSDIRYI